MANTDRHRKPPAQTGSAQAAPRQAPAPSRQAPPPGQEAPYEGIAASALPLTASEDRQWATLAHFGGVLMVVPSLLIYLVFRDRGPFTAQESKEALNFTLPPTIVALVALGLSLIPGIGGIFAVIHALIWLFVTICSVAAGIQVNKGRPYRYRWNLRLIP